MRLAKIDEKRQSAYEKVKKVEKSLDNKCYKQYRKDLLSNDKKLTEHGSDSKTRLNDDLMSHRK